MRYVGFGTTGLLFILGLFSAGCGQGKGGPQAEAPPSPKVEHEEDVNVVQVDHPEHSHWPLRSGMLLRPSWLRPVQ